MSLNRPQIEALKSVILEAIEITTPHAPSISTQVFTGCYDWHSSVHAHWALLSMARLTSDDKLRAKVLARLSSSVLAHERGLLSDPSNAKFEIPYGQAWLLLLLKEMTRGKVSMIDGSVSTLRQETEARLLDWLESSPFPDGKPEQPFRGDHPSWIFAYWLFLLTDPSPEILERLKKLRVQKIDPVRAQIRKAVSTPRDFLFIPAILALVEQSVGYEEGPPVAFYSPLDKANAHTAGAAMVRIWPYALRDRTLFKSRLAEMFDRPDQWKDDFELVSHWVPQFMWMGMWLAAGRP